MKGKVLLISICTILSLIAVTLVSAAEQNNKKNEVKSDSYEFTSYFIGELYNYDPDYILSVLQQRGANTLTIPIAWSDVERTKGVYDFSEYTKMLDIYSREKIKFILVLDASGRKLIAPNGEVLGRSIPDWVWKEYPESHSIDFYGGSYLNFDFAETKHQESVREFYNHAVTILGTKYKDNIIAFAPGINPEFEIKLSQEEYKWQTYSVNAKKEFRNFLKDKFSNNLNNLNKEWNTNYNSFDDIEPPIVDYNNNLSQGFPNDKPGFYEWMQFREHLVKQYITPLTKIIHSKGFKTIGYFGQMFAPHDAIYATGIIDEMMDLIDYAVVDFNFYDGYGTHYNPYVVPLMINYAKNLGYEKVFGGLFFEKLLPNKKTISLINQTLSLINKDNKADGIEIGGINPNNISEWDGLQKIETRGTSETKIDKLKIAIYVSKWNYYIWHGERSYQWNYLTESLTEAFRSLNYSNQYSVEIIGDQEVQNTKRLNNFDLVVIPSQLVVPLETKKSIRNFVKNGGYAIQDWRYSEFLPTGEWTGEWDNDTFGITGIEWFSGDYQFKSIIDGNMIRLPYYPKYQQYSLAFLSGENGSTYLLDNQGKKTGLINERTVVLGFQPQLLTYLGDYYNWDQFFKKVINNLVH